MGVLVYSPTRKAYLSALYLMVRKAHVHWILYYKRTDEWHGENAQVQIGAEQKVRFTGDSYLRVDLVRSASKNGKTKEIHQESLYRRGHGTLTVEVVSFWARRDSQLTAGNILVASGKLNSRELASKLISITTGWPGYGKPSYSRETGFSITTRNGLRIWRPLVRFEAKDNQEVGPRRSKLMEFGSNSREETA